MTKKYGKLSISDRISQTRDARLRESIASSRRASNDAPKKAVCTPEAEVVKVAKSPTEVLSARMRRFSEDLVNIGFTDVEAKKVALDLVPAVRELQRKTDLQVGAVNEFIRYAFATAVGNNPRVFEKFKNDPVFRKEGVEGVIARRNVK